MASVYLHQEGGGLKKSWAPSRDVSRVDFLERLASKGLAGIGVNGKYIAYAPSLPVRVLARRVRDAMQQPSLFGGR